MSSHRPRKRFGQHFLTDPGIIDRIVQAIAPAAGDTIVEIGPGHGAITGPLAAAAGRLDCIELDRDLATTLRRRFADAGNVTIHGADALAFDYRSLGDGLRIVGNLPYNISTPLMFALLERRDLIVDMHFMLQKEVVERMAASPGSKAYGRLGIMLGCHLDVEPLFDVARDAFDPPPVVTSSVVRLTPLAPGGRRIDDAGTLRRVVTTAFSQRRKTLRNALRTVVSSDEIAELGIDAGARPETLTIDEYVDLANYVARRDTDSG